MQRAIAKVQDVQWGKREGAWEVLDDQPQWRELGERIRQYTIQCLSDYLEEFNDNVTKRGGKIFFAQTTEEANEYVKRMVLGRKAKEIVESKSTVTTEVDIDPMLLGLDDVGVMETGLTEFVLQMDDRDKSSRIVFSSIHKNREQIRQVFAKKLGYQGDDDLANLAHCARGAMRKLLLEAEIGITGCNLTIMDSGLISSGTNEGNTDLTISIPRTRIVLMGTEGAIPAIREAEALGNLLARSAAGRNLTTYATLAGQKNANKSDGPGEFHMVVLDDGYLKALGTAFQSVLWCIRCGSRLSVCPVYRHIGGHGYGSIYPGPIGAVLSPILGEYKQFGELPYISSFRGACTGACPVETPLHGLLIEHRKVMTDDLKMKHGFEDFQIRVTGEATGSPAMFKVAMRVDHAATDILSKQKGITTESIYNHGDYLDKRPGLIKGWTDVRDLPRPPKSSKNFRSRLKKRQEGEKND